MNYSRYCGRLMLKLGSRPVLEDTREQYRDGKLMVITAMSTVGEMNRKRDMNKQKKS